ncbi:MAG TPA: alpha/beta hydrolase [Solirubrobacteraceae bacterium]|jgi:pimeloyl-ACP methyl ester carboxylesterase
MSATFTPSHRGGNGSPMVCLHGFTDSWRTWELVLEPLEEQHDVLALTLAGHAGGPPLEGELNEAMIADAVEQAMDEVGWQTAHIVGNSLGGYVSLQLAARGRAKSVVALAPAGGWADGDRSYTETLEHFKTTQELLQSVISQVDAIVASVEGRRAATQYITTNFEHIPAELLIHQMQGVVGCDAAPALIEMGTRGESWNLDLKQIECPLRFVWGTEDKLLLWPSAAARFREGLPEADWVVLDGIGHCIQLDVPIEAAQLILGFTAD